MKKSKAILNYISPDEALSILKALAENDPQLKDSQSPIWRRIQVQSDACLDEFHQMQGDGS